MFVLDCCGGAPGMWLILMLGLCILHDDIITLVNFVHFADEDVDELQELQRCLDDSPHALGFMFRQVVVALALTVVACGSGFFIDTTNGTNGGTAGVCGAANADFALPRCGLLRFLHFACRLGSCRSGLVWP